MLDIWMLFSLFLPFSQVLILVFVNHNQEKKENNQSPGKLSSVKPLNSILTLDSKKEKVDILLWVGRILIPTLAFMFAVSFFGVGVFIYAHFEDFMENASRC